MDSEEMKNARSDDLGCQNRSKQIETDRSVKDRDLSLDAVLVSEPKVGASLIKAGVQAAEIRECDSGSLNNLVAEVTAGNGDVLLAR